MAQLGRHVSMNSITVFKALCLLVYGYTFKHPGTQIGMWIYMYILNTVTINHCNFVLHPPAFSFSPDF